MSAHSEIQQSTAETIHVLVSWLGLTKTDFRQILGVTVTCWSAWERADGPLDSNAMARLDTLIKLAERLRTTFRTAEDARDWMHDPNRYLHEETPADALRRWNPERVDNALEIIDSGIFV